MGHRFRERLRKLLCGGLVVACAFALAGAAGIATAPAASATARDNTDTTDTTVESAQQTRAAAPSLTPGTLSVTGTPTVAGYLTVAPGTWKPTPASLDYQWYVDGVAVAPGHRDWFFALGQYPAGSQVTVKVTGTKPGYQDTSVTSTPVALLDMIVPGVPKVVAGGTDTRVTRSKTGSRITVQPGNWSPADVKLSYRWFRADGFHDVETIPGATQPSYTITNADAGTMLYAQITGIRPGYGERVSYSPFVTIDPLEKLAAATPNITGTAKVGKKLTASAGSWKPAGVSFKYQWLRNGKAIPGATKSSYTLSKGDAGKKVAVKVTGSKSGYVTASKTSATKTVAKLLSPATPKVSGTAKVGKKLTAKTGAWKPGKVSLRYQWLRSGTAIPRATESTYMLTKRDAGKKISVRVTGSRSGYTAAARTSQATAAVEK